jgi:ABC-type antimicrobial peptide transport system permease subunit
LVSYSVGQRTREIGIRMALGAQTRHMVRDMMRRALGFTSVGLALGFLLLIPLARALRAVFYMPLHGGTLVPLAAVALLLGTIAALAAFAPALRATQIDPMIALRAE